MTSDCPSIYTTGRQQLANVRRPQRVRLDCSSAPRGTVAPCDMYGPHMMQRTMCLRIHCPLTLLQIVTIVVKLAVRLLLSATSLRPYMQSQVGLKHPANAVLKSASSTILKDNRITDGTNRSIYDLSVCQSVFLHFMFYIST